MPKFRKKPVVIEAFQFTKERRVDNVDWPSWLHQAWQKEDDECGALVNAIHGSSDGPVQIVTLEGKMNVNWGDYIIQGVKGELYPCKPDIFEATYEPVI